MGQRGYYGVSGGISFATRGREAKAGKRVEFVKSGKGGIIG
jgi:hypothetical protein